MVLMVAAAADDDIDLAGNALADADFWAGQDAEVDSMFGVDPTLREIFVWENGDGLDDATNVNTMGTFQLNTWPNTRRITVFGHWGGIWGSAADSQPTVPGYLYKHDATLNVPMRAGDDWVSDGSVLYGSDTNSVSVGALFCYSYGQTYPYKGGHIQWISRVADAAEAAADALDQAWAMDLTGVTPGLDPHKQYVLRGIGHEAAATARGSHGAWAHPQNSPAYLVAPCIGDFSRSMHLFLYDGIPVSGGDGFEALTASGGAADTPIVWLGFEEYGEAGSPSLSGGPTIMPGGGGFGAGGTTGAGSMSGILNLFGGGRF